MIHREELRALGWDDQLISEMQRIAGVVNASAVHSPVAAERPVKSGAQSTFFVPEATSPCADSGIFAFSQIPKSR